MPDPETAMTLAILGAGRVGRSLGRAFAERSYHVRFGVTDPDKHRDLAADPRFSVGRVAEAIAPCEVVVLATPYASALHLATDVGDWGGRILVDATNPIAPGMSGLLVGTTSSGAQEIAARARNARVVKAFNTIGFEHYGHAHTPAGGLFLPVAGDDAEAKRKVLALAALVGFDAVDMGKLDAARYTEPLAMVWIELATRLGHGRDFGFVMTHTSTPPRCV
jgi:predicted dinucleotide-binding enzyme